jgi:CubicO group peptidase (beta-lactamase class C family)
MNFYVVIGVLLLCKTVFSIFTGGISGRGQRVRRSQSPMVFWFLIAFMFAAGLFMVIPDSVRWVQFGIEDTSADTWRKVEEFKQTHREKTIDEEVKEIREDQAKHRDQKADENAERN